MKHKMKKNKKSKFRKFVSRMKLVLALLQLIQNAAVVYYFYRKFFRKNKHSGNHKNKK